jgi:hypothetical protein
MVQVPQFEYYRLVAAIHLPAFEWFGLVVTV